MNFKQALTIFQNDNCCIRQAIIYRYLASQPDIIDSRSYPAKRGCLVSQKLGIDFRSVYPYNTSSAPAHATTLTKIICV